MNCSMLFRVFVQPDVNLRFVFLEDRLRALPSFRRLAFEEIHTAGHWGRKLSGGGSSAEITMPLANHLLQFLQTAPGAWAVESHACMMNNDDVDVVVACCCKDA